ncbi:hydroxylamine reductase [Bacteroides sp. 519]|uniref:hydroxylamine reductase n=1 Tax=Bacteroides sp. 519 TaxID=2302937 RepID=UPI0013D35ED8|nr:hydroxylamine reductase [Bacteroides sp. 519]NDV59848.1 hydroxylamine reductase [Bacteroides sp. 519]
MNMFCYQCQETAFGKGCTIKGVCGKEPNTSALMDVLVYTVRGIAIVNRALREKGASDVEASRQILDALFATITNANFDDDALKQRIKHAIETKNKLIGTAKKRGIELPEADEIVFAPAEAEYETVAPQVGVLSEPNEDIRSLKQMVVYGVKGMSAYTEHALNLGYEDNDVYEILENALAEVSRKDISLDELTSVVLNVGEGGVKAMALLDKANTSTYGNPEITKVNIGVRNKPGILISGHDLKDLEELLEQSKDQGVDIYTHSEMLPAHYYPAFKKYPHFAGNYGNAWWKQREEFETFNGVIFFTTNCIVPPLSKATYTNRVYTTGSAGYPGATHIPPRKDGKPKDFSALIEHAKKCTPPQEIEHGEIIGGFAHNQVLALADKVVDAVKSGAIRKFIVMAGCDGRMKSRQYYTDFALALPKDTVILTAGCAKYRYNKLPLGDINGIPRVLDAGQCNDSYSLVLIALALKDAFGLDSVNDLPLVFNIAWYEQKAVIVLLALLSLGVKNIHLGPTLPGFVSPNITNILVDKFGLGTISTADEDVSMWVNPV